MSTTAEEDPKSELEATLLELVNGEIDLTKQADQTKAETEPVDSTDGASSEGTEAEVATDAGSQDADVAVQGSDDGKQGSEPSEATSKANYLAILEDLGYDTDDMTQEEGKEAVLRLTKRSQPKPEVKPEPAVTEAKTLSDVTDAIASESNQTADAPKSSKEKRLGKLIRDSKLESLVEYQNDVAVPKEGTGAEGIGAATKINEYLSEYRRRVQRFAEDPEGFLLDDVEGETLRDKIEAIVQGKLNVLTEAQKKEQAKREQEQVVRTEQEKQEKFFADHTAELYKLRSDGTPKMVPGEDGDVPAFTEFGKRVVQEYQELYTLAPHQRTSVLMEAAYKRAKETQPAPVASPTGADKKKKFLESRGGKPAANLGGKTPASPGEMAEGGSTRLLDMILATPENADNPVLPSLRDAT